MKTALIKSKPLLWLALALLPQLWSMGWAEVIVPPEALKERVEQYILQSTPLSNPEAQLHVQIEHVPAGNIVLSGETLDVSVTDNRTTEVPWHAIVHVALRTESESRDIGFPIQVSIEKPVWVTARPVKARTPITRADLTLQRRTLSFESDYSLATKEDVSQYTSMVNIPAGQTLDVRKLKKTPAVFRNNDVMITLQLPGGVKVSCFGLAIEDGALGDRIRVRHRQQDQKLKIYSGQVIGKNQVLVIM